MSVPVTGSTPLGAASLTYGAFDSAVRAIQGYVVEPVLWTNSAFAEGVGRMAEFLARDMRRAAGANTPVIADAPPRMEERVVTVLFTDISGFTSLAERISAAETAAFLARHVRLLARCIAAESGTFDKFVGDAVMAYWGAPHDQPDHAARALRAAHSVAAAIRAENGVRRRTGLTPIRLRLGLHAGPVAIGDIGAPGAGTALFGDTVNTGQRIEQLAKEYFSDEDDVVGLASAAVLRMAGSHVRESRMRRHRLRGRSGAIAVSRFV
jgi:adenylate cyclase